MSPETDHAAIWKALSAPFDPALVRVRPGPKGRRLAYVTARVVMDRLDSVLGPENWSDDYTVIEDAVVCKLTVRLPDGREVVKTDVGSPNNRIESGTESESEEVEYGRDPLDPKKQPERKVTFADAMKEAFSDALKRAAVKFGVGRDLFGDAPRGGGGADSAPNGSDRRRMNLADPDRPQGPDDRRDRERREDPDPFDDRADLPRSGRALYGWAADRNLVERAVAIGKGMHLPFKMVEWNDRQVADVLDELLHAATTARKGVAS